MNEVNKLTALVHLNSLEWNKIWRPVIWEEDKVIIKVYKWQGEALAGSKYKQNSEDGARAKSIQMVKTKENQLFSIESIHGPVKWFKIRGPPLRLSLKSFKSTGNLIRELVSISRETLSISFNSKIHFFRVPMGGEFDQIPAVLVAKIGG